MKPVRYNTDDDQPEAVYVHEQGYLVKWDDYAALAAENERLRKAGDDLANEIQHPQARDYHPLVADWLAAKEGRDAK